jgi:hypothetical protein
MFLKELVSCLNSTLLGQFLREICPFKKKTPKYNAASGTIAGILLRKVLCHGVVRKGGRGAPKCIIQEEVKDRNKEIAVRSTVKAAHLQCDDVVKNVFLLGASMIQSRCII